MISFLYTFVAGLIGAAVGFWFLSRRTPGRRCFPAMTVEMFGLALGFSSSRLAFYFFPELDHGWARFATILLLIWVIFLPAQWWASRLRGRADET